METNINPKNESFFTEALIIPSVPEIGVKERPSLKAKTRVPFMEGYTAKYGNPGAVVFDEDRNPVASMGRCFALYVDPAHRGKGIAKTMIKEWLLRNRTFQADTINARTEGGKAAYAAGWELYKMAVAAEENANG